MNTSTFPAPRTAYLSGPLSRVTHYQTTDDVRYSSPAHRAARFCARGPAVHICRAVAQSDCLSPPFCRRTARSRGHEMPITAPDGSVTRITKCRRGRGGPASPALREDVISRSTGGGQAAWARLGVVVVVVGGNSDARPHPAGNRSTKDAYKLLGDCSLSRVSAPYRGRGS